MADNELYHITRLTLNKGWHRWGRLRLLDVVAHDCAHLGTHQLFPGRDIIVAKFTTGSVAPGLRQPADVALRKPVRGSVACQKIVDVGPDLNGRVFCSREWHRSVRYRDGSFSMIVPGRGVERCGDLGLRGVLRGGGLVCWWLLHVYLVLSKISVGVCCLMIDVDLYGKEENEEEDENNRDD